MGTVVREMAAIKPPSVPSTAIMLSKRDDTRQSSRRRETEGVTCLPLLLEPIVHKPGKGERKGVLHGGKSFSARTERDERQRRNDEPCTE